MFGYCGNLGHPTDPENGLIYMRARFYEPWTGRFLSEDPAGDGVNWYAYCSNQASTSVDPTGNYKITNGMFWHIGIVIGWTCLAAAMYLGSFQKLPQNRDFAGARIQKLNMMSSLLAASATGFAAALNSTDTAQGVKNLMWALAASSGLLRALSSVANYLSSSQGLRTSLAFGAYFMTVLATLMTIGALIALEADAI